MSIQKIITVSLRLWSVFSLINIRELASEAYKVLRKFRTNEILFTIPYRWLFKKQVVLH